MIADWPSALVHRLETETEGASIPLDGSAGIWSSLLKFAGDAIPQEEGIDIWSSVKDGIQITSYLPQANPHVISSKLSNRNGDYYVLKNTREKTYLRLSVLEYELWQAMDGNSSVHELIVDHYMKTNSFAHNVVIRLVQQLYQNRMLTEEPISVWSNTAAKVHSRSWLYRVSAPARAILTQRLSIYGIDRWITILYKLIGRLLFNRAVLVLCTLISILGLVAFSRLLADPSNVFLGDNIFLGLTTLWIVSIVPVIVHELGHALTVKHYGREVPRGGLLLYFGMPAAFVETTDIWLEPRRARLAVTWNGPFTGLILAGAASIFMLLVPASPANNLLFKFAYFSYLTVFFNVNPLLKLDGYYLLTDALDISSLRERSTTFVRQKFIKKLISRQKFSRDELVFTAFGLLSLLWTLYAIYLALFFWRTRIQDSVQTLISSSVPIVTRIINFLFVAAIVSFIFLITIQLFKAIRALVLRFARSGNLENHRYFALTLTIFALLFGLGLPLLFAGYARQISAVGGALAALSSAVWLFNTSRSYMGSLRGSAFLAFAAGMLLGGLALVLRWLSASAAAYSWSLQASILFIAVGFGLISWSALNWKTILLGLIPGSLCFALIEFGLYLPSPIVLKVLSSLALMTAIWATLALRGSARTPAIVLFTLGAVSVALSLLFAGISLDLAFAGTLLLAAGGIHLTNARLPILSSPGEVEITSDTRWSVGVSVGILIRRVIAQVFFESGFAGVERLGKAFGRSIHKHGVDIRIEGNVFYDNELPNRTTDELLEVYGLVFDIIHDHICTEFGRRMGTQTIGFGIDLLPWEYREVVTELILSRRHWGPSLTQEISDIREGRLVLLRKISLFSTLTDQEMHSLAAALREERYAQGEFVINQGDAGDKYYIIQHGVASVWQKTPDGTDEMVDKLGVGQYFGEVALISNAPRNASIRAETPLSLLSLNRTTFDRLVKKCINLGQQVNARVGYSWLLRGMPIFDELSSDDIDHLASRLEVERFQPGAIVFREGDFGDKFYLVASGLLSITHTVNGKEIEISRRGPGDYLGEIALIENRPRTATVTALEETELLSLRAEYFQEALSKFLQVSKTLTLAGSRRLLMSQQVKTGLPSTP
jgi:putative peptide zinc metalloprotease protein